MKVYSAQDMRDWDAETIRRQSITSLDLMERAAQQCVQWILQHTTETTSIAILCGTGNNGGDGLAIARLLCKQHRKPQVYLAGADTSSSQDYLSNLERLADIPVTKVHSERQLEALHQSDMIVDALFGTGLNQPVEGINAAVINYVNQLQKTVVAIDLPSGMFADKTSKGNVVVRATHTLTFQAWKTALLLPENAGNAGEATVLDIGLDGGFPDSRSGIAEILDFDTAAKIYHPRDAASHKGNFGHALLLAGSYGKMGAALLAARACLRSGSGLLTVCIPKCGYEIMQLGVPEAMTLTDHQEDFLETLPAEIERYNSVGIGPGIGQAEPTQKLLSFLLRRYHGHLVLDADALNILSMRREWLEQIPSDSILTPHPKEFDRLAGPHDSDFARMESARAMAMKLGVIIVLKGHHTLVALPDGKLHFNMSGNAGMAKGGSGDALTGIITSLVGQKYKPAEAALLGVYLHGLAGDLAAAHQSEESMTPGDLIEALGKAFQQLRKQG